MNRILLVDADEYSLKQTTSLVSKIRDVVVTAALTNGYEALTWLKHLYADICITELSLPDVDGYQLIEELRKRYPRMQVIAVSSQEKVQYDSQWLRHDDVLFMLKPMTENQLVEVLNKAINKINMERRYAASQLLLSKLPESINMVNCWCDMVLSIHVHAQPLLITDTLIMLEGWVGERIELLVEVSNAWIAYMIEVLKKQNISINYESENIETYEVETFSHAAIKYYFRVNAVSSLEAAANLFMENSKKTKMAQRDRIIPDVKSYIENHYHKKISLDELADHVAVSRSHLAAIFKKQMGVTIWTYCTSVRMKKAREYLLTSSLKCYEISLKVGYQNSIHFSRIFKHYHGMNPMEFRERFSDSLSNLNSK